MKSECSNATDCTCAKSYCTWPMCTGGRPGNCKRCGAPEYQNEFMEIVCTADCFWRDFLRKHNFE